MSSFAYGLITTKRYEATTLKSTNDEPPGIKFFIDIFTGLVPSEVLAVHGFLLSFTTKTIQNNAGEVTTIVTEPLALIIIFFGCIAASIYLFFMGRKSNGNIRSKLNKLDWLRVAIPPLAFVGWTMINKTTAFDALCPNLEEVYRYTISAFLAIVLVGATWKLAIEADK